MITSLNGEDLKAIRVSDCLQGLIYTDEKKWIATSVPVKTGNRQTNVYAQGATPRHAIDKMDRSYKELKAKQKE